MTTADAGLLALPPLGDGEVVRDSGDRECVKPSEPCPAMFGSFFKVMGHKDVRGRGSHVPAVTHVDPFILCDAVRMPKGAKPPFCAHPHCGTGVMTLVFQAAGKIAPWDNVQGSEAKPLLPGGIYHVDTGAGCVHDEPMDPLAATLPSLRANFGATGGGPVPAPSPDELSWFMQLWYNAMEADGPLRPVASRVRDPTEIVVVAQDDGVAVRCLAGSYRDAPDGLSPPRPLLILHCEVAPGAEGTLGPLPAAFNGFVWCLDGAVRAAGAALEFGARGLGLLPPGGTTLPLRNATDAPAQVLVALGLPHRAPYAKYVGYGGGFVHRDAISVEAAMAEYERDPRNYGRRHVAGAKPVDTSHLDLVAGFQDNDGPMMERPADVVARFKPKAAGPPPP